MDGKTAVILRLAAPPGAAALLVVSLSALTLSELVSRSSETPGPEPAPARAAIAGRAAKPATLSEAEALSSLERRAGHAALLALIDNPEHHERLFLLLETDGEREDLILRVFTALSARDPERALGAARRLLEKGALAEGPLLLALLEHLSRYGAHEDLERLAARDGDSEQLRRLKERYRDALSRRAR
jgi:hypothetical protein